VEEPPVEESRLHEPGAPDTSTVTEPAEAGPGASVDPATDNAPSPAAVPMGEPDSPAEAVAAQLLREQAPGEAEDEGTHDVVHDSAQSTPTEE
jgi:hypothetical protein